MPFDRQIDALREAKSPVLDRGNKILTAMEVWCVRLYGYWAVYRTARHTPRDP